MASQTAKPRPENGMTLLVIHDFTARSPDELSLTRGDRVELIERDDDFGDGWYLGRHETTGATGLFPEVYTKIAPVQTPVQPLQQQFQKSTPVVQQQQHFAHPQKTPQQQAIEIERQHEQHKLEQQQHLQHVPTFSPAPIDASLQPNASVSPVSPIHPESPKVHAQDNRVSLPTPASPRAPAQLERHVSAGQVLDSSPSEPAPLQPHQQDPMPEMPQSTRPLSSNGVTMAASEPLMTVPASAIPKNIQVDAKPGHGADSPVMNEALAVIQEHISDMSTPRNSQQVDHRPAINDSGSEYSMEHPGMDPRRMSYINGSETDEEEEEERRLNRAEVNGWTEEQVSEYLASVGVEAKHCEVFREQEISGDVLLAMDQPTVFLKEFDLGSVGRRLKTWQKIKALQDEVAALPSMPNGRRQTSTFSSEYDSEVGGHRVFSGMSGPSRVTSSGGRPDSRSTVNRYSQRQRGMDSMNSMKSVDSQSTAYGEQAQQTRPATSAHRPSAASIRELNHARRHSSIDTPYLANSKPSTPVAAQDSAGVAPQNHKKLPSFDRNWTMGSQPSSAREGGTRPLSQAGAIIPEQTEEADDDLTTTLPFDFDRGYFSGTEAEAGSNRNSRNVLKKRTSTHSRNSYIDETRQRSATTAGSRNSKFGSMDSLQQPHVSPAGAKYYGLAGSRRTPSFGTTTPKSHIAPPKDPNASSQPSPTVTKLNDRGDRSPALGVSSNDWLKPGADVKQPAGFRAISDAVTGTERKMLTEKLQTQHSIDVASPTHSSTRSPSRTGSSTPSGGPSIDLGDGGSKTSMSSTTPKAARTKSKKETSAYTRGLLKISPKEAMKDCDYSGWMKKKSTNLMTTWKPRLFILKGKRLSYYYSENDTEEKGLIDISFHRVLPADQDRLTGLHAQLTGAMGSPSTPNSATQTTAQQDAAAAAARDGASPATGNNTFIFKLVPPRAGLSRAVTFTKPTVHYFAVENVSVARLWMAALMKATIEREGDGKVTTTYQQKTISLRRAKEMRQRPPALRDDDEVKDKTGSMGLGLSIEDVEGEEKEEERVKEVKSAYRGVKTGA